MKIYGVGDLHGNWGPLNKFINQKQPDIILQVGDYGWWPHFHGAIDQLCRGEFDQYGIKNHQNSHTTKIFWCPGNHENWDSLDKMTEPTEVQKDISYMPFGSTLTLPDGRVVLFVGGADSIDKDWRTPGVTWWRQETISYKDMMNLPEIKIDVVISHTAPKDWIENALPTFFSVVGTYSDPSTIALQQIREKYQPTRWLSGHIHKFIDADIDGCHWTSLSHPTSSDRWWTEF